MWRYVALSYHEKEPHYFTFLQQQKLSEKKMSYDVQYQKLNNSAILI